MLIYYKGTIVVRRLGAAYHYARITLCTQFENWWNLLVVKKMGK